MIYNKLYRIISILIILTILVVNVAVSSAQIEGTKNKNTKKQRLDQANFSIPGDIILDSENNLLVLDRLKHQIKKVDLLNSNIFTIVGNGKEGFFGDGGQAIEASLSYPSAIVLDENDNLFIADDYNSCIRRVDAKTGVIETIVGKKDNNSNVISKEELVSPVALVIRNDDLFIADKGSNCIKKVDLETNIITTIVGNEEKGYEGDGGKAKEAKLDTPTSLVISKQGQMYIVDSGNSCIRKVDMSTGIITTIIDKTFKIDEKELVFPLELVLDKEENLLIVEGRRHRILKFDFQTQDFSLMAGNGVNAYSGDGGQATKASLFFPGGICLDEKNNSLFIADSENVCIRKVDLTTGIITTIVKNKKY